MGKNVTKVVLLSISGLLAIATAGIGITIKLNGNNASDSYLPINKGEATISHINVNDYYKLIDNLNPASTSYQTGEDVVETPFSITYQTATNVKSEIKQSIKLVYLKDKFYGRLSMSGNLKEYGLEGALLFDLETVITKEESLVHLAHYKGDYTSEMTPANKLQNDGLKLLADNNKWFKLDGEANPHPEDMSDEKLAKYYASLLGYDYTSLVSTFDVATLAAKSVKDIVYTGIKNNYYRGTTDGYYLSDGFEGGYEGLLNSVRSNVKEKDRYIYDDDGYIIDVEKEYEVQLGFGANDNFTSFYSRTFNVEILHPEFRYGDGDFKQGDFFLDKTENKLYYRDENREWKDDTSQVLHNNPKESIISTYKSQISPFISNNMSALLSPINVNYNFYSYYYGAIGFSDKAKQEISINCYNYVENEKSVNTRSDKKYITYSVSLDAYDDIDFTTPVIEGNLSDLFYDISYQFVKEQNQGGK